MRVCVFAVWRWQFVSSSFVFPWESVKYPGCLPDLGEGLRHPRQMLRFTLWQVSGRPPPPLVHWAWTMCVCMHVALSECR